MANLENANAAGVNYGDEFAPCKKIMVIKKDGSLELAEKVAVVLLKSDINLPFAERSPVGRTRKHHRCSCDGLHNYKYPQG